MQENIELKQDIQEQQEYDVVGEINKIKENMINKAEYDKLKAERDNFAKALVEGTKVTEPKQAVPIADLRERLFGKNSDSLSNLDYVQTALELREAILKDTGKDIFVGSGSKLTPDDTDFAKAQKVASALEHCIAVADGDSETFTRELMRITDDVKLPRKRG